MAVQGRGPADDLTGERASSESDASLLLILYCKTQGADFSFWSRELKDIGDDWPRPKTEYFSSASALHSPRRTVQLFGLARP